MRRPGRGEPARGRTMTRGEEPRERAPLQARAPANMAPLAGASAASLGRACLEVLTREFLLTSRRRAEAAVPLIFFVAVGALFPLALGPESALLRQAAPGIVWVAALLAVCLSLDGLFRPDFEDGTLDQWLLSPHPLSVLLATRVVSHWILSGLPLLLAAALLGILLRLPAAALAPLLLTLIIGTPTLCLVGAVAMALVVGLRQGSALPALLLLPLYVPVLIVSTVAVQNAAAGRAPTAEFYFLGGMLLLALALAPPAAALSLRVRIG